MISVLNCQSVFVFQGNDRISKIHFVLSKIIGSFGLIPLVLHGLIVCTIGVQVKSSAFFWLGNGVFWELGQGNWVDLSHSETGHEKISNYLETGFALYVKDAVSLFVR